MSQRTAHTRFRTRRWRYALFARVLGINSLIARMSGSKRVMGGWACSLWRDLPCATRCSAPRWRGRHVGWHSCPAASSRRRREERLRQWSRRPCPTRTSCSRPFCNRQRIRGRCVKSFASLFVIRGGFACAIPPPARAAAPGRRSRWICR